jgi:HEAT repeat protein
MGRELRDDVFMLCDYYGDRIIPALMKALINEESPSVRRFMLNILTGFGEKVIPAVLKGLEDDRWFVKRNMLFILMDCGNEAALKNARPCCDHENPKVSFEAIKCLLKAGDDYGITALRKYLNTESRELVNRAVVLAGAYRVRNVVPDLLRMLSKRALRGSDIEEKIPAVRALGQIGDPRAVGPLNSILSARKFLFKDSLKKLKEEIRSSLRNYSLDEAEDNSSKKAGVK